jgi:hypothetical protein
MREIFPLFVIQSHDVVILIPTAEIWSSNSQEVSHVSIFIGTTMQMTPTMPHLA